VYVIRLIRGSKHNILFDSGFHRKTFEKLFPATDYLRPDEAVKLGGVKPEEVTDVLISHAHWDHIGGIDLLPKAAVWIQKEEFRYYTGEAWQTGGNHGGIDPEDVKELVQVNMRGICILSTVIMWRFFRAFKLTLGDAAHMRRNIFEWAAIRRLS
jgi:glyoxylase-like metal-dependent hydrolase (beta-lactamase superfamily II)